MHFSRQRKLHFLLPCHWLSQALIIRILDIYEELFSVYYCFRCLLTDAARQFTQMREFTRISVIMSKPKTIRKMGCFSLLEYICPINSGLETVPSFNPLACHNKNWQEKNINGRGNSVFGNKMTVEKASSLDSPVQVFIPETPCNRSTHYPQLS